MPAGAPLIAARGRQQTSGSHLLPAVLWIRRPSVEQAAAQVMVGVETDSDLRGQATLAAGDQVNAPQQVRAG